MPSAPAMSSAPGRTPRIPIFQYILAIADRMYEEQDKNGDSLIETLWDLADFDLF